MLPIPVSVQLGLPVALLALTVLLGALSVTCAALAKRRTLSVLFAGAVVGVLISLLALGIAYFVTLQTVES